MHRHSLGQSAVGQTGEGDFVTESMEGVLGGAGNDLLTTVYDSTSRRLIGNNGNDTMSGDAGNEIPIELCGRLWPIELAAERSN